MYRLALTLVLLFATPAFAASRTIERVVAVVNDEIVLDSELSQFAAFSMREPIDFDTPEGARMFDELKKKSLDKLIEERLIAQAGAELKLAVTNDEVERSIEEVMHQNKLDKAQFVEALKGQGFTLEGYKKNMKKQILQLKVINTAVRSRVSVSEEEVRTAYLQSDRQYAGERMAHLREVVIKFPKDAPSDEVERKRRVAAQVVTQARNGRPFTELAKAYSEADSKSDGGDLGWVQSGSLVDVLGEVVGTMDPGDVRGPIRTPAGFSVLELVEWKSGNLKPYDEVKDQLRRQLYDAQVEKATTAWVRELRKKAHVDVR